MNRARRKTNRKGKMKRLVNESLVLSATRFVSSHVVRFFATGFASPVFNSVKKVDDFARKKITGPLFEKTELRKNITQPIRNSFSLVFERVAIFRKLKEFRLAALNASLRSVGIFLLTFGIYAAAMFLAKHYMGLSIGAADTDDIIFAAISFFVGLILTVFGDKSILSSIGTSRSVGTLITSCLGVNDSSLVPSKKTSSRTAASVGFLLGSLFGILTLFYSPFDVIAGCVVFLMFVAVMNIPEFGLMTVVFTASFVPVGWTAALAITSLASYLFKCLRLKRNMRFGSADALVLILFAVMLLSGVASDGGLNKGEIYILAFVSLYFLARNLVRSERLLFHTFNSLTAGLRIGMTLYILGEYAMYIPNGNFRMAAYFFAENILSPEMLIVMAVATLPFSFSLCAEGGRKRRELRTFLLVIACAILINSFAFYALALVSLFLYVMLAYKAPAGALLGAVIVLSPAFAIISKLTSSDASFSIGKSLYDSVLEAGAFKGSVNYWSAFTDVNGAFCTVLFGIAMILAFYRVFGCMSVNRTSKVSQGCGAVASSAIMMLTCSLFFNPFADLRVLAVMWFALGLCGSVYHIYFKPQYSIQEV